MDIEITQQDGITIIRVVGRLDSRSADEAKDTILAQIGPGARILLEMSELLYMSSAGMRVLLLVYREIGNKGGSLVIVGLSDPLQDLLSMTGFSDFFAMYDTLDAGKQALSA